MLAHRDTHQRSQLIVQALCGRAGRALLQEGVAILLIPFLSQIAHNLREIEREVRSSTYNSDIVGNISTHVGCIGTGLPPDDTPKANCVVELEKPGTRRQIGPGTNRCEIGWAAKIIDECGHNDKRWCGSVDPCAMSRLQLHE